MTAASRVRGAPARRRPQSARDLVSVTVLVAACLGGSAGADPTHVLRLATIAPDGTEWARLSRSFAREVEQATDGAVRIKWYFGGIAGDELDMIDRVRRGQLDGVASGGMLCQRLAPSLRVVRVVGLFQSRDEARYVLGRLKPRLDEEFAAAGFVNLGEAGFGSDVVFSRTPLRSYDEMRRARLWIWDTDDVFKIELSTMGLRVTPLAVHKALAAFESGEIDGFVGIATAALAYQWSSRARYFSDLRVGYLMGCLAVAQSALDPLPMREQKAVAAAAGKLMRQMENMGEQQDELLLDTLFQRQGMTRIEPSETLRSEFFAAARAAREHLGAQLTSPALLSEVTGWLADYRSEHHR